jgi:hypothetical protein
MELAAISSAACPALLKSLEDSIAPKNLSSLAPTFWGELRGRPTDSRGRPSFDMTRSGYFASDLRQFSRIDTHLFHSREQRSPLKAQAGRSAVRAADTSLGLL